MYILYITCATSITYVHVCWTSVEEYTDKGVEEVNDCYVKNVYLCGPQSGKSVFRSRLFVCGGIVCTVCFSQSSSVDTYMLAIVYIYSCLIHTYSVLLENVWCIYQFFSAYFLVGTVYTVFWLLCQFCMMQNALYIPVVQL